MRAALVLTGLALAGSGCGLREDREAKLNDYRVKQAQAQYQAARDNLSRCVAAKMTALAYADLGNTADASVWRTREQADCQAAYAGLGPVTDLDAEAR